MLSYFRELVLGNAHKFRIIPSSGANDLGPLISLYLGWGRPFVVLLDDDKAGRDAAARYQDEWFLTSEKVRTIGQIVPSLKGKALESLLSDSAKKTIAGPAGGEPSKKEIGRFFQERFAQQAKVTFDQTTIDRVKALLDACGVSLTK
ncbi:MAG: hypothetical protein ISP45_24775 [Reyranella sp.]|jgi:hypothetical protein|nr:hypothetical protein [Reyranella sp.]